MKRLTLLLSLAAVLALAAAQMTPTERLNEQRRQQLMAQQQALQAQQQARRVATRRLNAPCVVPDSYYPFRTCKQVKSNIALSIIHVAMHASCCGVTTSPAECARGYNAFTSFQGCCVPGPNGAFPQGCTDFNANLTCYIPANFWPQQLCVQSSDFATCSRNWGQWPTKADCCRPGRGFADGCTETPAGCWIATEWEPSKCSYVANEKDVCTRGWGAFQSEEDCCKVGAGFSEGCSTEEEVQSFQGEP